MEKEREISFLNSHVLESANHKVIVLLDRSPKFAAPTSAADISFVVRDDQGAPINGKFRKTLWNCSTETIMEFHRVVSDMFQRGHKQIRVVISDFVGKFLTGPWSDQLITHDELLKAMMGCAPPEVGGDASSCSIRNGLLCALEAIGERTPLQKSVISSLKKQRQQQPINGGQNDAWPRFASRVNVAEIVKQSQCSKSIESNIVGASPSASQSGEYLSHEEGEIQDIAVEGGGERTPWNKDTSTKKDRDDDRRQRQDHRPPRKQRPSPTLFQNKGTIVVVTSIGSSSEFDAINEYIAEQILDRNEASRRAGDSSMVRIDHVDVYVLNILAGEDAAKVSSANLNLKKRRPLFTSRLISVTAGPQMIPGIHKILQKIYDLVSTTVSGIPMKEETQSGQSVNYDVEMLHPRTTHFGLSAFGMLEPDSSKMLDSAADHAQLFRSVRLKWCTATAKLKSEIFPLLQDSFPITPAHVNNRASVCLTTFILNGKNVMLEVQADAYHQQKLEPAALGPNLKEKLISHYLSRGVNGSLIIHSVGIGPRATLNDLLSSDRPYGDTAADELRTRLNCRQLSLLAEAVPIQPIPLPTTNKSTEDEAENKNKEEGEEFEEGNHNDDYAELFERINLLAGQKLPFRLRDSFIFNIPEKFEPILTVLAKPQLSPEQMEQCRVQIRELAASAAARNGSRELTPPLMDKVFPCTLFKGGTSAGTTKEEQIRVALAELGRLLQQFASLSAMHSSLLAFFCETTGLRLSAGVEPQQQPTKQQEKPSRKRQFPVESDTTAAAEKAKVDEQLLMQQRIERRRAQVAALWAPGEEINLFDWWKARYEQEVWSGWKGEFEGHRKYGDKAQDNLYPNLNLKLPPGQSKGAGTGTAGPIE